MASGDLKKLAGELKGAKILVMGDLMLDTYLMGEAARISPEAPVPVVRLKVREDRPGGAANCAMNVDALGGSVVLAGCIGTDESGIKFNETIKNAGFDSGGVISDEKAVTIHKVRIVAGMQQIVRVDEERIYPLAENVESSIIDFLKTAIPGVDAVAVSDYAKGFVTPRIMTGLHDLSRMHGVPVLIDPKPVNANLYRGCDLIKPNVKETSEMSKIDIIDDETCDLAAERLMDTISPRALLITRGAEGMALYRNDKPSVRIKAGISRVYDVSGAGDTVLAVLAMAYARKIDPAQACMLASAAAAVVVRKPGTSTLTREELIEEIGEDFDG